MVSLKHNFNCGISDDPLDVIAGKVVPSNWNAEHDLVLAATSKILGRKTAGAGTAEECSLSEILDFIGSAAQGDILFRGASGWQRLAAGTSGQFLQTQGVGADLRWNTSTSPFPGSEVSLSSASMTDLGSAASNLILITGNTTITSFGSTASTNSPLYCLRFSGAPTLTHNATTLIIPGGTNKAVAAGDSCIAQYLGSGNWKILTYTNVSGTPINLSQITNSLSGDVALNNASNYFDGPAIAQGTSGTWFVSGTVSVTDSNGSALFYAKLWDGVTVIDSAVLKFAPTANLFGNISLSGYITSPAGNLRISVKDSSTLGKILFNQSGESKDSTISAIRIV